MRHFKLKKFFSYLHFQIIYIGHHQFGSAINIAPRVDKNKKKYNKCMYTKLPDFHSFQATSCVAVTHVSRFQVKTKEDRVFVCIISIKNIEFLMMVHFIFTLNRVVVDKILSSRIPNT